MAETALPFSDEELQAEEWRPVVGFPDYEVSDLGRVRSVARRLKYERAGLEIFRTHPAVILQPGTVESGHQLVVLGRGNSKLIHALVLLAFVGPRPPGHDSLHADGHPSNNRKGNLRWGTRKENVEDTRAHGRMMLGDSHVNSKLCSSDIPVIRKLVLTLTEPEVAKIYGVSRGCIQAVKRRVTWKSIEEDA